MLLPSSSTFSSEQPAAEPTAARPAPLARVAPGSLRKILRTGLYFVLSLLVFELGVAVLLGKARPAAGSLHRFLWYGASYEAKLRELAATPNLPPSSILYAGWLGDGKLATLPSDVDVTIYGMSFSANLSQAIHQLRPDLRQRTVGGPGAPLSHTYAIYQADKKLRRTRVAVIGATSGAVQEVLLMNRGSLFSDSPFPYFFPRYKLDERGQVVLAASSLINSADELRAALADPALWRRQLDVLAANDDGYRRFYFAADPLDGSVLGRLVRRGLSKHHLQDYQGHILRPKGFQRDHEAPRLFRALLRQMVHDLRAENVQPIVALFALQGQGNHLYDLVQDILREEHVPYMNTYDICPSEDRHNYQADLHFVPACDLAFARRTLELVDAAK